MHIRKCWDAALVNFPVGSDESLKCQVMKEGEPDRQRRDILCVFFIAGVSGNRRFNDINATPPKTKQC